MDHTAQDLFFAHKAMAEVMRWLAVGLGLLQG
jgi:hypothetical protein